MKIYNRILYENFSLECNNVEKYVFCFNNTMNFYLILPYGSFELIGIIINKISGNN
jgi:hypothetical protein